MPPFMMEIDAARCSPLDQLAIDYLTNRQMTPTIDFCRRVHGIAPSDREVAQIAARLDVAISKVRGWREIGKRASGWSS
jgi:DICT domain-containing protein